MKRSTLITTTLAIAFGLAVSSPASAIIGGAETTDFGAIALLDNQCNAVLIAPRVLLTAAQCSDGLPEATSAYFGSTALGTDPNELGRVAVVSTTVHPGYSGAFNNGSVDMAIVLLAEDAPAQPIAYRVAPMDETEVGAPVTLVGWGTNTLDTGAGIKRFVNTSVSYVQDTLVGFGDASATTCWGEAGAAVLMDIDGTQAVIGLSSFIPVDCDGPGAGPRVDPTVATFINPFLEDNGFGDFVIDPSETGGGEPEGEDDGGGCSAADGTNPMVGAYLLLALFALLLRTRSPRPTRRQ